MVRLEKSRGGMHHLDGRPTAQRKSLMKQKLGATLPPHATPATPAVAVDYPRNGDRLVSDRYTFRVSAPEEGSVEVSIDDDAWQPCRRAAGYWWRDWSGFNEGPHSVFARVRLPNGRGIISDRREFTVDFV
jgi:hypothetical protein